MKFSTTLVLFSIGNCLRTIDEIYVDDPKKAFNSKWESIAQVVHENQEWKREMRHVSSRKKFVEEMINIKTVIPITPVEAIHILDNSPHCWILMAYNSYEDDNLKRIKDLTEALVELYYERCGVGVLDLGYPSNHFTFGEVVEDTPMIIFRKPYAMHQMFHIEHLHNDKVHFQVDKLHKWGHVFPADDLDNRIWKVINEINHLYEHWVDKNYKLLAVGMEHYQDKKKKFLQLNIDTLLKRFHHEAVHRAKNHLGLLPSDKRNDLYTVDEIEDNDERFFNFVTDYIHHRIVELDLLKWLSRQFQKFMENDQLTNDQKKEILEFTSPVHPRPQPPIGHLLTRWIKHNEL